MVNKSYITRIAAVLFLAALATGCVSVSQPETYTRQQETVSITAASATNVPVTEVAPISKAEPVILGAYKFSLFAEAGIADTERPSGSLWQQAFAGYYTDWDTRPAMFRVGVELNGFRFSYFDLGKYRISAEAGDDEAAISACSCVVGGDTDMYFTKGNMRGFALTYNLDLHSLIPITILRHVFIEGGPARFRFALSIRKDDGWQFDEHLSGLGHVIGIRWEYKNLTIGWYGYRTNIGGKLGNGETPAGTGGANVLALGYAFK
jgi:hypothetical protein